MSDKRLLLDRVTAQFTLKFTFNGEQCRNILYARYDTSGDPGPHWGPDELLVYGQALTDAYVANYMPLSANDCSLDGVDCVANTTPGEGPLIGVPVIGRSFPFAGGEPGDGSANNVTLAIKLSTGFLGRSFHGRFYFVGINSGLFNAGTPNKLKAGSVGDFSIANQEFLTAVTAIDTGGGDTATLAVASFVSDGSDRASVLANTVTQISLTDSTFDSQRRRLPGRGI